MLVWEDWMTSSRVSQRDDDSVDHQSRDKISVHSCLEHYPKHYPNEAVGCVVGSPCICEYVIDQG